MNEHNPAQQRTIKPLLTAVPFELLRRCSQNEDEHATVLPGVHDVLRSPGQPLDAGARAYMEPRFGHDFSRVRVHTDAKAMESARAINAQAYTAGQDIVFSARKYEPWTMPGRRLLAHELSHVLQQSRVSGKLEPESSAEAVEESIVHSNFVTWEMIGSASPGIYKKSAEKENPNLRKNTKTKQAFRLNPDELNKPEVSNLLLPPLKLESGTSEPETPSRLRITSSGRFSLGLRLGFPEFEAKKLPGAPSSYIKESMRRAKIIDQQLTGKVPSAFENVDQRKFAPAVWGIFSTKIAPDLARGLASRLSTSTGPAGTAFELDLVILADFNFSEGGFPVKVKGGGLSFTVRY